MNVNGRDAILDQARMRLEINRPADPWSGLFIHLRAVACFAPKPASIVFVCQVLVSPAFNAIKDSATELSD